MKKTLFIMLIMCLPLINVKALSAEEELENLETNITNLNQKIETFENARLNKTYPVGSILETTNYSTVTQVQNALGGTWQVYGSGRILVGINTSDTNFNTVGKTGGASSVTLSTTNLPSHTHTIPALSGTAASAGSHTHKITPTNDQSGYGATIPANSAYFMFASLAYSGSSSIANQNRMAGVSALNAGAHTHTVTTTASTTGSIGSGTAFTNIQPSIAVYRYKRIS